ncbi:MAG: gluconolactonase [Phenylobacterium sp.]|nr:gluconolactonase [Phenylobacterium sp.]
MIARRPILRRHSGLALAAAALAVASAAHAAAPRYRVADSIPGPDGGWDYVRVDAEKNRLLAPRGTGVMEVDLATRKVTAGLAPGGRQHIALPLNHGREMLVTNGASDTAVFADVDSGATLASVPTGKGPDAAALDPRSGLVLVMDHAGGDVTLVDPTTRRAVGRIAVGGDLEEAVADGSGRAFVNVENQNQIAVIDIAARKVVARWPLGGCEGPTGLAYDVQDRELIAACDGTTDIVRAADGQVLQTLPTGKGADGAAYDAQRRLAFVPAGRDGTLAVIAFDKGRARLAQTLATERGARTLALDDRTGRLYLPTAKYGPPPAPGARPSPLPGTFHILVVSPQ